MRDVDPASPPIAVGCSDLPPGMNRAAYFRQLGFLEIQLQGEADARIARRWREDAGQGTLALVAPRALGPLHRLDRASLEAATENLARVAGAAAATAVVFVTSPDLSPSTAHRDTLRRFFSEVATAERFGGERDGRALRVWQPGGLWTPIGAAAFAEELGIIAAVDPLAADPLEEGVPEAPTIAYARVSALGRPPRPLGADKRDRLVDWAAPSERAFIVFATPHKLRDAVALARAIGEATPPPSLPR